MTFPSSSALLTLTPEGLYCPAAGFHIDPLRPVARALITHGHSDHARAGHGAVLATQDTLDIMAIRYGANFSRERQTAHYGKKLDLGTASKPRPPRRSCEIAAPGAVKAIAEVANKNRAMRLPITNSLLPTGRVRARRLEFSRTSRNVLPPDAQIGTKRPRMGVRRRTWRIAGPLQGFVEIGLPPGFAERPGKI